MEKKLVHCLIIFIWVGGSTAFAQSIVDNSYLGARNVALGSANVSESRDISSMFENPAAVTFLEAPSVMLNHVQGDSSEMQENLSFPVLYDNSDMLAVGTELYTIGELSKSNYAKRYEVGYDLAFGRKLSSVFGLGGSFSFRHGVASNNMQTNAASYTLGVEYAPSADVNYGLTLGGIGTGADFVTTVAGVTPIQSELSKVLEVGALMRFPSSSSLRPPFLVLALASQKEFGSPGATYRGGIEYYPVNFLALRLGYVAGQTRPEQRFGIGFRDRSFSVDLAAFPHWSNGSRVFFEELSVTYGL